MKISAPQRRYIFRKERVGNKIFGTAERPRLSVYRSLKHVYAQAIDDAKGHTIASVSSLDPAIRKQAKTSGNVQSAAFVGKSIAQKCLEKKIKKVVFDRGGRIFHGVVKSVADAAREGGLEF